MTADRRRFLRWASASVASSALGACAASREPAPLEPSRDAARVVVIGGGYGGATAAKYVKLWAPEIDVTLIEREPRFVSCPLSNLVVGGNADMTDITMGYGALGARGVRLVRGEAAAIDADRRRVRLAGGTMLAYDRLIVAPGVDFIYDDIPGLRSPSAQARIPHAWKAGEQTLVLRRQLAAMRDGGVFVIHIPLAPFRCPPGPYERVCQVADYFKRAKPRSKIIVLDTNQDLISKRNLFLAAWQDLYGGIVDYQPNSELVDVDVAGMTVKLQFDDVKGDVINVVPPQQAAGIVRSAGLLPSDQRWCAIDWQTAESTAVPGVHVLGDATLAASAMPKSATMANQHGKLCAAAVIARIRNEPVNPRPVIINTCYSFVDATSAVHVASVHAYDSSAKTMLPVKGAGGLSSEASTAEGRYAWGWARNIWSDTLA